MKKNVFSFVALVAVVIGFLFFTSCENTNDPVYHAAENDVYYYEYSDYFGTGSSLWLTYHYEGGTFKPANTNTFKTDGANLISDNCLYVALENLAPSKYLVANKLPIKYSDYGKFELTSDKQHVYNGLFECTHKDGQAGKFLIALNSETNTASIYFFKTKEVLRKKYDTRFGASGNPELAISGINAGMGEEVWIISNNMIAVDYHQTGVYTFSILAGDDKFTYINSLLVIDDKR